MKNWVTICNFSESIKAEIVKGILEEHDIDTVLMDKKDSNYHFGFIEVMVEHKNVLRAIKIVNEKIEF